MSLPNLSDLNKKTKETKGRLGGLPPLNLNKSVDTNEEELFEEISDINNINLDNDFYSDDEYTEVAIDDFSEENELEALDDFEELSEDDYSEAGFIDILGPMAEEEFNEIPIDLDEPDYENISVDNEYSADEKFGELLDNLKSKFTKNKGNKKQLKPKRESKSFMKYLFPIIIITIVFIVLKLFTGGTTISNYSGIITSEEHKLEILGVTSNSNELILTVENVNDISADVSIEAIIYKKKLLRKKIYTFCDSELDAIEVNQSRELILKCSDIVEDNMIIKVNLHDTP